MEAVGDGVRNRSKSPRFHLRVSQRWTLASAAKKAVGRKLGGPKKPVPRSVKAGLQFLVSRYLENGRHAQRVGTGTPVYFATVLGYLAAEAGGFNYLPLLDLANNYLPPLS
ncbi:hypothetical protein EE612_043287 [Oryza sativa]|nr:hypothetical protein EE612_043287 [Oryza sativa]